MAENNRKTVSINLSSLPWICAKTPTVFLTIVLLHHEIKYQHSKKRQMTVQYHCRNIFSLKISQKPSAHGSDLENCCAGGNEI